MSKLKLILILIGFVSHVGIASNSDTTEVSLSGNKFVVIDKNARKDLSFTVSSDRPSASYSSLVIPRNRMTIETGGVLTINDSEPTKTTHININNTLIRYGLFNNLEVRLGWNYDYFKYRYIPTPGIESDELGLSPLFVGGKVQVFAQSKFFKNSSIVAHINIRQLASPKFRTPYNGHNIYFISDIPSSGKLGMTYNLGISWNGFSPQAYGAASTCFTYSLGDATAFAELYTTWSNQDDFHLSGDAGVQWLVSRRIQLDASAGIGLYNNPSWFVSGGIACLIF